METKDNFNRSSWKKRALITGVCGQIGSYLAEILLEKGYDVYGIIRRTSQVESARERIAHLQELNLFYGDLGDSGVIERIVFEVQPDEIYNLAAQSHVWISFHTPEYTSDINALGTLRICEAARKLRKPVKIYQASTSELYGGVYDFPVNEKTPFHPKSPYGIAKLYAYWTIRNYREAYKMFCSNGIVFNSESPRRGENFVTRKITRGVADIINGKIDKIHLGNLNARRDWNHAKDTALAMWKILQTDKPDDYVIASGKAHSVKELVEKSFKYVGIEIGWKGSGIFEVGYDKKSGREYVVVDPYYFRPSEANVLIGDATKARVELGWAPSITFDELIKEMMEHDLKKSGEFSELQRGKYYWPKNSERFHATREKSEKSSEAKMEFSPLEILDKMSILKLKIEEDENPLLLEEYNELKKAVEDFRKEGVEIKNEWLEALYSSNKKQWDIMAKIKKEILKNNLEEIGRLFVSAEIFNKERGAIKNLIANETGVGFKEIDMNS